MAGPRAPIGTLSQHATAAASLVRNIVPKAFRADQSKAARKSEEHNESNSDSDSGTTTDSDVSDSDDNVKQEGSSQDWAERMKAKKLGTTPQSMANGAKVIKTESPASATKSKQETPNGAQATKTGSPASTRKVKQESPADKPSKKPSAAESSASESESESESDSGSDGDSEENGRTVNSESDSDEESEDDEANTTTGPQLKKEVDSGSESESSDEEMAGTSPAKSSAKSQPAKATRSTSSSESGSESESESGNESDSDESESGEPASSQAKVVKKAAPAPKTSSALNGEKPARKAQVETAAQSSKAAKEAPKTKDSATKPSISANGSARSKEFVSESDSESADSEAESPESDSEDSTKKSLAVQAPRELISEGFCLRKAEEDVDAAMVARVFQKAKAEGKQIWYFTAPKSVPIEVIQKHTFSSSDQLQATMDKIRAGEPIFTHEGADYGVHTGEQVNHAIKVMIPGNAGTNYETLNHPVNTVLHIRRVTRFGHDGESQSSSAVATTSTAISNAPRPQPKGLKARYVPFGVPNGGTGDAGAAADSDGDVEMTHAPPLLTGSAADTKDDTPKKAAKKRKHGDVEKGALGQEEAASTPKKSKKARVEDSSTPAVDGSSAKATKQTPIAPPPIPALASTTSVRNQESSEPAKPSPAPTKKSKNKDKATKKESAPAQAKPADPKKPVKVTPVMPPAVPGVKSA